MEKAIKRAVEGGYEIPFGKPYLSRLYKTQPEGLTLTAISQDLYIPTVLLDPLFWQALGKAEGWKQYTKFGGLQVEALARLVSKLTPSFPSEKDLQLLRTVLQMERVEGWEHHWHRFIDHLADGGSADEFFISLIENKE